MYRSGLRAPHGHAAAPGRGRAAGWRRPSPRTRRCTAGADRRRRSWPRHSPPLALSAQLLAEATRDLVDVHGGGAELQRDLLRGLIVPDGTSQDPDVLVVERREHGLHDVVVL